MTLTNVHFTPTQPGGIRAPRKDVRLKDIQAPPILPKRIGRYIVERLLGQGGFGLVYHAYDEQLNRKVAIKVPHLHMVSRPQQAEMYLKEARTVANLDHPHIVPVFDVGSTAEFPFFIVSKYIEGSDLATRMKQSRLSYQQTAELIADVADGLHCAHKQELVHRDVKPGNILIDNQGKAYVVDFGIALHEYEHGNDLPLAGTPAYMSPEQIRSEGHRVSGRSDIFSLGVILYELLTGKPPFKSDTQPELLEQILNHEPIPPIQVDDRIPPELDRICLKALSKRATERYATAEELAEELRGFCGSDFVLNGSGSLQADSKTGAAAVTVSLLSHPRTARIVPKGLRSFDAHDAEFFLELLPGPRDRDGLPDCIRFWKSRIEESDSYNTFALGLIYGPSGCGKTSMVKAGLLPRLYSSVITVYVEAAANQTEYRLKQGLRRCCPDLPEHLSLADMLAMIRHGQSIPPGSKILIVIDQFEQWLHATRTEENPELIRALRQCDGGRIQCLVMVRDDFWMPVTRFVRELEISFWEGQNSSSVDLFDLRHAQKVLAAFGRAFGLLPEQPEQMTADQKAFLKQAVQALAEDGKVICVRLSLFADMMKGRPWTLSSLKEVGGIQGVGATFLEEMFNSASAPPEYKHHQDAARRVLRELLPEPGHDIKGGMQSFAQLKVASGYQNRPRDFDDLIRVLDTSLRLIAPTSPEAGETSLTSNPPDEIDQRYYQLTHDYLVPSLREWLSRKQKETWQGRAELKLAERSALWNSNTENQLLPSLSEFLSIRWFTRRANWTPSERQMMHKAGQVYSLYSAITAIMLLAAVSIGVLIKARTDESQKQFYAQTLVQSLLSTPSNELNKLLDQLDAYRSYTDPALRRVLTESDDYSKEKLNASLALAKHDPSQVEFLLRRLLSAESNDVPIIVAAIAPYQSSLLKELWSVVEDATNRGPQMRAAVALARFAPDDPRWPTYAPDIANSLTIRSRSNSKIWIDALRPVGKFLSVPLQALFFDHPPEREAERPLIAVALAEYLASQPEKLVDVILQADNAQEFHPLLDQLRVWAPQATPLLRNILQQSVDPNDELAAKAAFWKKQATAAVCLLEFGDRQSLKELLKHSPNPSLRSFLIHRFSELRCGFQLVATWLEEETDLSTRRALILSLGNFDESSLLKNALNQFLAKLTEIYRQEPDAGIHAAVAWTLRHWKQQDLLSRLDAEPSVHNAAEQLRQHRNWFVNSQDQTMIVISGPIEFDMGDQISVENLTTHVTLKHSFAMAAYEVTVAQFHQFRPDHQQSVEYAPTADCPINKLSWYDAAAYCNWLSQQDGLPESEWCYAPNEDGEYAAGMRIRKDFLQLTGYRLPTQAEWEYACRAGSTSTYYFGETRELLSHFAWWYGNSDIHLWPVGSLKPNDFGFFDMHGNAHDWSQDIVSHSSSGQNVDDRLLDSDEAIACGGSFYQQPVVSRTTKRWIHQLDVRHPNFTVRPVRTIR